jgi:hypothetical protein
MQLLIDLCTELAILISPKADLSKSSPNHLSELIAAALSNELEVVLMQCAAAADVQIFAERASAPALRPLSGHLLWLTSRARTCCPAAARSQQGGRRSLTSSACAANGRKSCNKSTLHTLLRRRGVLPGGRKSAARLSRKVFIFNAARHKFTSRGARNSPAGRINLFFGVFAAK